MLNRTLPVALSFGLAFSSYSVASSNSNNDDFKQHASVAFNPSENLPVKIPEAEWEEFRKFLDLHPAIKMQLVKDNKKEEKLESENEKQQEKLYKKIDELHGAMLRQKLNNDERVRQLTAHYNSLFESYTKAQKNIADNEERAQKRLDEKDDRIDELRNKVISLNSEISSKDSKISDNSWEIKQLKSKLESEQNLLKFYKELAIKHEGKIS